MRLSNWFQQWKRSAARPARPVRRAALHLSTMEERLAPATHTWTDAAGTNKWSDAGNWTGGVPTSGEAGGTVVVLPLNDATMTMDIPTLTLDELRFSNSGSATLTLTGDLLLNAVEVSGRVALRQDNGTSAVTITGDRGVELKGSGGQFVEVDAGGALTVTSKVSGPAGLKTKGNGTVTLTGAGQENDYKGATVVGRGTLRVGGSFDPDSAIFGDVTVEEGATLRLLQDNVIADRADLTIDGTLDLNGKAEAAGNLQGVGVVVNNNAVAGLTLDDISGTRTFEGTIGGTGPLTVRGKFASTGVQQLVGGKGSNTYTGLTIVIAGTLEVGGAFSADGGIVGNISVGAGATLRLRQDNVVANGSDVFIDLNGTFDMNSKSDAVGNLAGRGKVVNNSSGSGLILDDISGARAFFGTIAGAGGVWVRGGVAATGVQQFLGGNGSNTYGGVTTVSAGRLEVGGAFAADGGIPGNVTVSGTGTLRLLQDNVIANGSDVTVNAGGTFDLSGKAEAVGNLTGGGSVKNNTATLTLDDISGTRTFSGAIAGTGGVTLRGQIAATGTQALTGANTYTGATQVGAGTLRVDGTLASPVTLGGGQLAGDGTVGAVTALAGKLAPNPGAAGLVTLRTGNLGLGGATFAPLVTGSFNGARDQVVVAGTVNVTGATLAPTRTGNPAAGHSFVVIDNDGTDAVTGTFAGLPEGATLNVGGQQFRVTYRGGDGNDVVLEHVTAAHAVANFGATTYRWNGTGWQLLRNEAAQQLDIADDGTVFGVYVDGVRRFAPDGTATLTTPGIPQNIELTDGGVAFGDFGGSGLFVFNGASWQQITAQNPSLIDASDDGSVFAHLPTGLSRWRADLGWQTLTGNVPSALKAAGNGVVYGVFPNGVWRWQAGAWTGVTGAVPQTFDVSDAGQFFGDFGLGDGGPDGVWRWSPQTGGWTGVTGADPATMSVTPDGSVYGHFLPGSGATGLWRWDAGTAAWSLAHAQVPVAGAAAIDGSYFADFGGYAPGLWRYTPGGSWVQASPATPSMITTRR